MVKLGTTSKPDALIKAEVLAANPVYAQGTATKMHVKLVASHPIGNHPKLLLKGLKKR